MRLILRIILSLVMFKLSHSLLRTGATVTRHKSDKVVVVIGGGAAGYFSAIECASSLQKMEVKSKVYVLEAGSSVLSKVLISGGGRCNVMHNPEKSPAEISKGYPRGSRELLGPLTARFGPREAREWFTSRGVQLKTERDGRVFPTTDRSTTITTTLERAAKAADVTVKTGVKVVGVQRVGDSESHSTETDQKRFIVTYQASRGSEEGGGGHRDRSSAQAGLKGRRSSLYAGLDSEDYQPSASSSSDGTTEEEQQSGAGGAAGARSGSRSSKETFTLLCDGVIMATGSSRLGYDIVRGLGHAMQDPLPSLFSFKIKDAALTSLSGVSCNNAKVTLLPPDPVVAAPKPSDSAGDSAKDLPPLRSANTRAQKQLTGDSAGLVQRGPLLITKQGLSGPAVLKLSAFGARLLSAAKYRCTVQVSWLGDLSAATVAQHLAAEKAAHPARLVSGYFPQLTPQLQADMRANFPAGGAGPAGATEDDCEDLGKYGAESQSPSPSGTASQPLRGAAQSSVGSAGSAESGESAISRRLWLYLLQRANITDPQLKWRQLTPQAIADLAKELTAGLYQTEGRGLYRDEFVTCGGVKLSEVNFKTMQSRLQPGLFLAGEVLDVDGITGGYNFQSAWTTGYIAGQHCAASLGGDEQQK